MVTANEVHHPQIALARFCANDNVGAPRANPNQPNRRRPFVLVRQSPLREDYAAGTICLAPVIVSGD